MNLGYDVVPVRKIATPPKCVHCHQPIVRDRDNGGLGFTYHHKDTGQQSGPEPSILGDDSHYAEPHDGYSAEEMKGFTASRTATGPEDYQNGGYRGFDPDSVDPSDLAMSRVDRQQQDHGGRPPHTHPNGVICSEEWCGSPAKTSSRTAAAQEVGYYVCSRNGVPISGPYATRSDAAPNMIEQRGAAVMFIGPGNSAEWDALKAKQFPVGSNTVNGSKRTDFPDQDDAYHPGSGDPDYSEEEQQERERRATLEALAWATAADVNYNAGSDDPGINFNYADTDHKAVYNGLGTDGQCEVCGKPVLFDGFGPGDHLDPDTEVKWRHVVRASRNWDTEEDPWAGESLSVTRTASVEAPGLVHGRPHKFQENPNWGDESSCTKCGEPKGHSNHTDRASATTQGSMQERYADARRLNATRHFADDELAFEDEWEKQPKGLGDQVDTGVAPASEIQDPNPLAGQDLERIPRNLAEATLWAEAEWDHHDALAAVLDQCGCKDCVAKRTQKSSVLWAQAGDGTEYEQSPQPGAKLVSGEYDELAEDEFDPRNPEPPGYIGTYGDPPSGY